MCGIFSCKSLIFFQPFSKANFKGSILHGCQFSRGSFLFLNQPYLPSNLPSYMPSFIHSFIQSSPYFLPPSLPLFLMSSCHSCHTYLTLPLCFSTQIIGPQDRPTPCQVDPVFLRWGEVAPTLFDVTFLVDLPGLSLTSYSVRAVAPDKQRKE